MTTNLHLKKKKAKINYEGRVNTNEPRAAAQLNVI